MRRIFWISTSLMLALATALAGCGKRQAVASGEGLQMEVPDDTGGYARGLAAPPKSIAVPDIEKNIEAGQTTNSQDPDPVMPEEDEQKKPTPEELEAINPSHPDTSGDSLYASVSNPVVAVQTNQGTFYLELWPETAPHHVDNFLKLAKSRFYDGIIIHRVEPGFVVQAGDPLTRERPLDDQYIGTGGPGWTVKAEFSDRPHLRGTLSMARAPTGDDTAGSQFFICLDKVPELDRKYTVFGQVLGLGMDVVDKLVRGDRLIFVRTVHE